MRMQVVVSDNDTLVVFAKTPPTVEDPAGIYPYASQTYRVVVVGYPTTLVLVPIGETSRITKDAKLAGKY